MRLCVKVPVLSTHKTLVVPSASMACAWRVSTWCCDKRQAPSAIITVQTTANSSGTMAMAKVRPTSTPSLHEPWRSAYAAAATRQMSVAAMAMRRTSWVSSACTRLGGVLRPESVLPMRPSVVCAPVALTMASPSPSTTSVPA